MSIKDEPADDATGKPAARKNARGRRRKHTARLTTRKKEPIIPNDNDAAPPRGEAVRQSVRHAALECFGAFGFEGTSTRAVADRAGISHSLLLYHFGSKDELWKATMEDVLAHYASELQARLDTEHTATGKLRGFVEHFVRYSARVPQLHRIMTQQSTQGSERIEWMIEQHLRPSFEAICDIIHRAQAEGGVKAGEPGRLYYAIIGLGGTLLSVSTEFRLLTGRDVFTEPEIRRTIEFISDVLF